MQFLPFPADWRDRWHDRLPLAVEGLLVIALAVQAARLVWLTVVPPAPFGTPVAVAAPTAAATAVVADPFYRNATTVTSADVSGLRLFGVRATGADGGSAILAGNDGAQGAYTIGDEVRPGAVLRAVAPDHVVLEIDGARQRLDFAPEATALGATPTALPAALPSAAPAAAGPPAGIDPQQLLAQAGLRPRIEDGRVTGYSVIPRGDGALLRQAGLQSGDVLLSVNGQTLTPERYQALAEELAGEPQITLTYRRDGETRTTTLQAKTP